MEDVDFYLEMAEIFGTIIKQIRFHPYPTVIYKMELHKYLLAKGETSISISPAPQQTVRTPVVSPTPPYVPAEKKVEEKMEEKAKETTHEQPEKEEIEEREEQSTPATESVINEEKVEEKQVTGEKTEAFDPNIWQTVLA